MTIKLKGSLDGSVSFTAPADTSPSGSDITLTLPTTAGSANQFVKNSGTAGTLEYSSMVETSTGVGINTTGPQGSLHVGSTVQFTESGSNVIFANSGSHQRVVIASGDNHVTDLEFRKASDTTAQGRIRYDTADRLRFFTAGSERVRIDGGNVGIGTTNPGQRLEINNTTDPFIRFGRGSSYYWDIGHANSDFQFNSQTGGTIMHLEFDGNVGIGTTSPDSKVHIVDGLSGGQLLVASNDTNSTEKYGSFGGVHYTNSEQPVLGIAAQSSSVANPVLIGGGLGEFNAATDIKFYTASNNTTTTGTQRLIINNSGNVGIGLTNPATKLEVNGDIGIGRSAGGYTFREVVGGGERAGIKSNSSNELVFLTGGAAERLRIMGDGDIRFNQFSTSTPGFGNSTIGLGLEALSSGAQLFISRSDSSPFLVNRNSNGTVVDLRRSGSQKGNIQVTTSTATFNSASDYRLKENVAALSDGITRLKQLNPSRFNFIEEPDTTVDGFIAHEVQAVVPEAVTGTHNEVDDDGNPVMQGMDYGKVTPLLTAALQEAIAKIETLETKVAALEAGS